jgi:hypothetical protein
MSTRVVHCKEEPYDVYIGRPSKWGNPFKIGRDGTREVVLQKYQVWLAEQWDLLDSLDEVRGKVLGCHCKPYGCHGDILALVADHQE